VLLDFSKGIENPAIAYLGRALRDECQLDFTVTHISDVPSRSLLSRLTDHYLQIIANRAPIGFEAEFVSTRGQNTLYRGILMPFSSDGEAIDFIYGVINWKELVDAATQAKLDDEVDAAVRTTPKLVVAAPAWADGPSAGLEVGSQDLHEPVELVDDEDDLSHILDHAPAATQSDEGSDWDGHADEDEDDDLAHVLGPAKGSAKAGPKADIRAAAKAQAATGVSETRDETPAKIEARTETKVEARIEAEPEPEPEIEDEPEGEIVAAVSRPAGSLTDQLLVAQQTAAAVLIADSRTRTTLYRALSRAHEFAAAADAEPAAYEALLEHAGITLQLRAPMTPIVKLVFGADYDKTRLTEYAAVLSHARRVGVATGKLNAFLEGYEGGIKGVVKAERAAKLAAAPAAARDPLAAMEDMPVLAEVTLDTELAAGEYVVLLARVVDGGTLDVIAAIEGDPVLNHRVMQRAIAP
jgi:hypothetical protein